MGRYRITRHISATCEQTFRAFTDPALIVDWMDATSLTDATGPLDKPETRYTLVIFGPWRFRSEVIRVDQQRLHEVAGIGPLGASYRMVATLTPNAGGTDLDLLTEYKVPFGALGRWLDRRFIDREPRTAANREVDRLVTLVSDPAAVPQPRGASQSASAAPGTRATG
jgi:hypothetical protein